GGCGMPGTAVSTNRSVASSASADLSQAESVEFDSINNSGQLDELDDETLSELADEGDLASGYSSQLLGLGSTKIGYIRSTEDGKFFLQAKQGIWKRKDVSYTLVGSKEDVSLKLAKKLNDRVLVRGTNKDGTITVKSVYQVPDTSVVLDMLRTGCVSGKVYSGKTLVGLNGAAITLRSIDTGRIYRATTNKDGRYHVSRLVPGDYSEEITLAGYSKGILSKVTVAKRKSTSANVPLTESSF
ncbi:MAG TPA: carboxypeptidase-like regulatory domain-containing protein, partial [Stenomitos sp.]